MALTKLLQSGWDVYEQGVYKVAFKFVAQTDREMPELREADSGEPTTKDGKPRVLPTGETRWIVIEPYLTPNYYINDEGEPSRTPTAAHKHPGTAVYWKPPADAARDWQPVANYALSSAALEASGRRFPAKLIALTVQSLLGGAGPSEAMIDALLASGDGGPVLSESGVEFAFFQSRALCLGRIINAEEGETTINLPGRDEVAAPGDLLVVELNKERRAEDQLEVAAPLLMRRINKAALAGQMWIARGVSARTALRLLYEATSPDPAVLRAIRAA